MYTNLPVTLGGSGKGCGKDVDVVVITVYLGR